MPLLCVLFREPVRQLRLEPHQSLGRKLSSGPQLGISHFLAFPSKNEAAYYTGSEAAGCTVRRSSWTDMATRQNPWPDLQNPTALCSPCIPYCIQNYTHLPARSFQHPRKNRQQVKKKLPTQNVTNMVYLYKIELSSATMWRRQPGVCISTSERKNNEHEKPRYNYIHDPVNCHQ